MLKKVGMAVVFATCALALAGLASGQKPLGPMPDVNGAVARAMGRLAAADLRRLSQTDPLRASAYLAVAANVERLKRAAELRDARTADATIREVSARLAVLDGQPAARDRGLYSLLGMSADPASQVIVEYPSPTEAWVVFRCGSVPLLGVRVEQCRDGAAAELAAGWVMDRRAVSAADSARLRQDLVSALAPSADGEQVAAAVRSGRAVALLPGHDRLLYDVWHGLLATRVFLRTG